jgi:hypothetical protein
VFCSFSHSFRRKGFCACGRREKVHGHKAIRLFVRFTFL